MLFLWIKALHIIAVITWMAAIFYLPRLFVYHSMSEDQISRDRFVIMEQKLLRIIGNPSMIAVYIFGIWMTYLGWDYYSTQIWYWCKITLIAMLTTYHHACVAYFKQFRDGRCTKSHKFFRIFNEIPVLILFGIVILVVVKPF